VKKLRKSPIKNFVDRKTNESPPSNNHMKGIKISSKAKKVQQSSRRDKIDKNAVESSSESSSIEKDEEEIKKMKKKLAEIREEIDVQKQRTFRLELKLGQLKDEATLSKANLQEILSTLPEAKPLLPSCKSKQSPLKAVKGRSGSMSNDSFLRCVPHLLHPAFFSRSRFSALISVLQAN